VGGLVAAVLSGVVDVQCFAYFKFYSTDFRRIKVLVTVVWLLDFWHTIFVSAALWDYLIIHYGDSAHIDFIPWTLALTIFFTAVITFLVHCFFVHRIYKLSQNNLKIAILLGGLAVLRLGTACFTTVKMITLRYIHIVVRTCGWSLTLGLSTSLFLEILITGFLFYFLMCNRTESTSMNRVIDTLILYSFESGSLICAATVASLIFWLTMPTNSVFIALYFIIGKLYANSLLATLNTRRQLQRGGPERSLPTISVERPLPVVFSEDFRANRRRTLLDRFSLRPPPRDREVKSKHPTLQINVEKTICTIDDGPLSAYTV